MDAENVTNNCENSWNSQQYNSKHDSSDRILDHNNTDNIEEFWKAKN